MYAEVWVEYADHTTKTAHDSKGVLLMGPEYDYQLIVDNLNQIPRSLSYYADTRIRFHVEDRNGNPIDTNGLSWRIDSNVYQYENVLRREPGQGAFSSSNSYAAYTDLKNINKE